MIIQQIKEFHGGNIEILEMILSNEDNKLKLSWCYSFENEIYTVIFYNVSRLKMNNLSVPLEVQGLEIINHSQNGWEKDSRYEICDFENNCITFFCESFEKL